MEIPELKMNNGLGIPLIGLGTWKLKRKKCIEVVRKALELGYNHIDTAEVYENEKEIGEVISNFDRKKLFITSKVFPPLSYNKIIESCENSLLKLKTDYLDLYLIHWPRKKDNLEYIKAFKKLIEDGKIKTFGVSNFTINHLKDIIKVAEEIKLKISVNQVEFHPLLYQKDLLKFCMDNNIVVTAYSPLARGKVYKNKILKKIGEKYNKTAGQISLRWLLQKNLVVIPKASSEEHLKENLDIFNFFIEKEDEIKIDNLNVNKRFVNPYFSEFNY